MAFGGFAIANDQTVDETHHVERRSVDRGIVAEAEGRSHGHRCVLKCGDDPMFATHVVGTREDVAEWGASNDVLRTIGTGHAKRQIGMAAGDQIEREGATCSGDVGFEPRSDSWDVDTGNVGTARAHAPYGSPFARGTNTEADVGW